MVKKIKQTPKSAIAGPIIALLVIGVLITILGIFSQRPLGKAASSYFCDDGTATGQCSKTHTDSVCYYGRYLKANACISGKAFPPGQSCGDNTMNLDETDIDCGGTWCPACVATKRCLRDTDCQSNVCIGRHCAG